MNSNLQRKLLLSCLPQLASYLFDQNSALGPFPVGWRALGHERDELDLFLDELVGRHAIACGQRFGEIVSAIERRVSLVVLVLQEDSRGAVRGRLDPQRYLARRAVNVSLPRTYPVLVNRNEPQTPENALVCGCLSALVMQLTRAPFTKNTAEGQASGVIRSWAAARLRRDPWATVRRRDLLSRLVRESEQRIRKRQTGNDESYAALVRWVDEWLADPHRLGVETQQAIVNGLLSFPAGKPFWQKVFEIWCVQQAEESLQRLGWIVQNREPLHRRSAGPISRFSKGGENIELWFQRQDPLGDAYWKYEASGMLRGIPDIVLTHSRDCSPLLVDAKYRYAVGDTRSEETYKFLGYAENFRSAFSTGFFGILCFVAENAGATTLLGPNDGETTLLRCNDHLEEMALYRTELDKAMMKWLGRCEQVQ